MQKLIHLNTKKSLTILTLFTSIFSTSSQSMDTWCPYQRISSFANMENLDGLKELFPLKDLTPENKDLLNVVWNECLQLQQNRTCQYSETYSFVYQKLSAAFKKAPTSDRIFILQRFTNLFGSIQHGHFDILQTLCSLPKNQQQPEIFAHVVNLLSDIAHVEHRQSLGQCIISLEDNLPPLLSTTTPFLKSLKSGKDRFHILSFINRAPNTRHAITFENIKKLFPNNISAFPGPLTDILLLFNDQTLTANVAENLHKAFSLIPAKRYYELFTLINFSPDRSMELILQHLINYVKKDDPLFTKSEVHYINHLRRKSDDLKLAYDNYWIKLLAHCPDQGRVKKLSTMITLNQHLFSIQDDSPVLEEARIAATPFETDVEYTKNPVRQYDPYRIYQSLVRASSVVVDIPLYILPKETIEDKKVCINTNYFKKLSKLLITNNMLPPYDPNCIKTICGQINKRLNKDLEDRILDETGITYTHLKQGSLQSQYLDDLLSFQRGPNDPVPLTTAKFICIIAYLEGFNNTLPQNPTTTYLTDRENNILKMGASIFNCPTGKRGGIDDFYALLPYSSKIRFTSESLGHEHLETILRTTVSRMFSGTNLFFQQIIDPRALEILSDPNGAEQIQAIHQALHIKNLIGKDVGLWHTLTFDRDVKHLRGPIADVEKEPAMRLYYKNHFTPDLCIKDALRETNEKLPLDAKIYNQLIPLLSSVDLNRCWDFDDNYNPVLNRYGATCLFIAIGAFKVL